METKPNQQLRTRAESKSMRTSVTFSAALHADLEHMAKRKKVSVAWVVRDAAEKYVAEQYSLFNKIN